MTRFHRTLLLVVLLAAAISVGVFTYQSIRNHNYPGGNDLTSYLIAARDLYQDQNPFVERPRRYIYPLFLAAVTYPLAQLQNTYGEKALVAGLWALLTWAAFFWMVWKVSRALPSLGRDWGAGRGVAVCGIMVVLLHPFLQDEFLNSQVNVFMAAFATLYFLALERGRTWVAGTALALAAALKIAPGLLVLDALYRKKRVTVIVFGLMVLVLALGWPTLISSRTPDFYLYFFSEVTESLTAKEARVGFYSYSLLSTVTHVFGIAWAPGAKLAATMLVALGLAFPAFQFMRRGESSLYSRFLFFAVLLSIVPLTFPMSEPHHLLLLTIPVLIMADHWRERGGFRTGEPVSWLFAAALVCLHTGHMFKTTPLRFLGVLTVYLGLAALLRRVREGRADGNT